MDVSHRVKFTTHNPGWERPAGQTIAQEVYSSDDGSAVRSSSLSGMPTLTLSPDPVVDAYMVADGQIRDLKDPRLTDFLKSGKIPEGWKPLSNPILEQVGMEKDKQALWSGSGSFELLTAREVDDTHVVHGITSDYDVTTGNLVGDVLKSLNMERPLRREEPKHTARELGPMKYFEEDVCELGGLYFQVAPNNSFDWPFSGCIDETRGGHNWISSLNQEVGDQVASKGYSRTWGVRGSQVTRIQELRLESASNTVEASVTLPNRLGSGTLTQTLKAQMGDWKNVTKVFTCNPDANWPPARSEH